jgi:hypothetical protein
MLLKAGGDVTKLEEICREIATENCITIEPLLLPRRAGHCTLAMAVRPPPIAR